MGREQDLIQAVKNGDIPGVQKLVAKIKASKSSEYLGAGLLGSLLPLDITACPKPQAVAVGSVWGSFSI